METHKILIVEDELTLLTILKDKFLNEGLQVFATQSGEKAYDIVIEEKPDLILTDLIMYPTDGIALIKKIRASGDWGSKVKCIIISNENKEDLKEDISNLKLSKYLNKSDMPINLLITTVKEIID